MKLLWILILSFAYANSHATTLKMSTLNIRWFGLGGTMEGTFNDEKRDANLKQFINNVSQISQSEVIALQEIVDQNKIQTFFPNHKCTGYDHPTEKHQHVMICVKKPMKLVLDAGDRNFIWEDVADIVIEGTNIRLRPAVHGKIQNAQGVDLAHVIAVHLKAEPDQSNVRMEQTRRLKKHMENDYKDKLPVIITGDFNTHIAKLTGLKKDDVVMMSELYQKGLKPMNHVTNTQFTFRSSKDYHTLDHYWISNGVKSSTPVVWSECKKI